ncbi:MAG: amidophosphoribosyltransferase [Planctomycetes bacterium]|nr:amidophosphoribosyltransferase [Planctomycetota bacterium]
MTLGHYCGLFGIYGDDDAVLKTYFGLQALQHRGQEGAGIASWDGRQIRLHAGQGLVTQVFDDLAILDRLAAPVAIGHVRYSTSGGSTNPANCQPLLAHSAAGAVAVAHNGDLTNKNVLRGQLEARGSLFQSTTDTETILHLLATSQKTDVLERLHEVLPQLQGAYSLLIMTPGRIIAVRDPRGFRPLVMGKLGDSVIFASEDCAFSLFEAERVRELEPGEIVIVDSDGIHEHRFTDHHTRRESSCIFEHIYFARPDSKIFGENVHQVRMKLGRTLAIEHPCEADLVTSVPDSGNSASIGFAQESGIPLDRGFIKNHYVGRTFIHPDPKQREMKVRLKINAIREVVEGKRVVVVDDSIIRGTTSLSRVGSLRKAGAKEVHLRITCPPTRWPCFFGIDFPTREELIAASKTPDEIARFLSADSLGYLSEDGLVASVSRPKDRWCMACFNGDYPAAIPSEIG